MVKTRILVAEDEDASARLIEVTLKSLGYAVPAIIPSGEEAVKKAGEVHPDLVLMDIRLKGDMDGVQAAEEISMRFNIPVVYLTAHAESDILQRAKITEPYGYLLKPFSRKELHTTIDIALYKHKMDSKLKESEQALEKRTAKLKRNNEQLQREINERRQVEELYRTLANSSPVGVYIFQDGNFRFVNPQFHKYVGYTEDELLGMESLGLVHPEDRQRVRENAIEMLKGNRPSPYEFRTIRKGGEIMWAIETVTSIQYKGRLATLGNFMDITERKKAQQVQERLRQQLQTKINELEALSYGIAHDLRSPLLSIEGFSRLLRDDIQNQRTEKVREDIRLLESGVRRMQQFLSRTLEYSRAGHLIKQPKNVPFGKIIKGMITDFAEQMRSIGATVSLTETFPGVCVDELRIKQVLTNLLQNSIKYRDEERPLKIEIGHRLSKGEIVFFVRDNGLGIEASERKKVFDLFYRGTTDGEGSGAGLAIVKRIIEAHGGRVWVEGQPKQGTTICFTLSQIATQTMEDTNGEN